MTFCAEPGCGAIVPRGRCQAHRVSRQQTYDRSRGSRQARGYDDRWARRAAQFKASHPLCGMRLGGRPPVMSTCHGEGRITLGDQVDHVVPHRGDLRLFWDDTNWQTLCAACHMRKTVAGL